MSENQTPQAFDLVMEYLNKNGYGVTYRAILDALQDKFSHCEITKGLDYAVNTGECRFTYQPGPEDAVWKRAVDVVFYPALNLLLPVATEKEVEQVVEYFSRHEDYGRMGDGPTVILEVAKVYRGLMDKMSVQKITHALITLRQEELLYFTAREQNGYLTVTLPGRRRFTVMALEKGDPPYYGAPNLYKMRYFHVRAGSTAMACEKVRNYRVTDGELIPQMATEEYLSFEAAPGHSPVQVIKL